MDHSLTKTCGSCGRDLPRTEFRLRRKGANVRHSECQRCHVASERRRTKRQRRRYLNVYLRDMGLCPAHSSRLDSLTRAVSGRLGGLDGLVNSIMAWHQTAQERRDTAALLRFFEFVAKLLEVNDLHQRRIVTDPISTQVGGARRSRPENAGPQ